MFPLPSVSLITKSCRLGIQYTKLLLLPSALALVSVGAAFAAASYATGFSGVDYWSDLSSAPDWLLASAWDFAFFAALTTPAWVYLYRAAFHALTGSMPETSFMRAWRHAFALTLFIEAALLPVDYMTRNAFSVGILTVLIYAPFMFAFPVIVLRGQPMWPALSYSCRRFFERPISYFLFFVALDLVWILGVLVLGIGLLWTTAATTLALCLMVMPMEVPVVASGQVDSRYPRDPAESLS